MSQIPPTKNGTGPVEHQEREMRKDAALVTVINPLQTATVAQAAETPGHALHVAHKRKLDKSWQPCQDQGIV